MIRKGRCLIGLLLGFFLLGVPTFCQGGDPVAVGADLPKLELRVPEDQADQSYLGVSSGTFFTMDQLHAKLVILEVLSVYCPVCMKQAPNMNKLYRYIQDNSDLKDNIKIFAVAAGNKAAEISVFRTKLEIPFPVLPDPYVKVNYALGSTPIPAVYVVNSQGKVLFNHIGLIQDIDDLFLKVKEFYKQAGG